MLTPKNWKKFQHYKHRSPPWIKLHRQLLDDPMFIELPVASRALAPCLWLLASDYQDGIITLPMRHIAIRLRMTEEALFEALNPLISAGFFTCEQDASNMLAPCKQNVSTETETETETEKEQPSAGSIVYAFERGKIRLSQKDFNAWEAAFSDINLRAELESLAEWAGRQKNWFPALSAALGKRNREALVQKAGVAAGVAVATRKRQTGGGYA